MDNPTLIRSQVFPYKRISDKLINQALNDFARAGKLFRYEHDDHKYIQIATWWEHQQLQWAAPSKFPSKIDWSDKIRTNIKGKYLCVNWPEKQGETKTQVGVPGGGASLPPQVARQVLNPNPNPVKEDTKAGDGAFAPPAPDKPSEIISNEKTPAKPDDSLLVSLTPGGQVLLRQYETLAASKGKRSALKRYANEQQRKAFEAVYASLNGELGELIDKGFAHNRTTVSALLSWLEGCVKRAKEQPPIAARFGKQTSAEYYAKWEEKRKAREAREAK